MPSVVFQEQSTATVKVSGREQIGSSGTGGPQAFPPPPVPPPPPPPPPTPQFFFDSGGVAGWAYMVTPEDVSLTGTIGDLTAVRAAHPTLVASDDAEVYGNVWKIFFGSGLAAYQIRVPAGDPVFTTEDGRSLLPGDYPCTTS